MEQLRASKLTDAAGVGQSETFIPTAGDVFITTFAKCGTTLMQQMVQSLRTGGDLSFEEISMVIPFMELHHDFGYDDLDAPQPGCLRAFKTHLWKPRIPGGFRPDCKYIYVMRDPVEVSTSMFHFFDGWFFPRGSVPVEEFVRDVFLRAGEPRSKTDRLSIWHHLLSWYPERSAPNMLFLFYEDLVKHKSECVRLVADFLNIPLDEALEEVVVQQTSKESMAASLSKYDDHPLKGKVRSAPKAQLSEATVAAIRQRWVDLLEPVTGCASYDAFRSHTNAQLGRPF